ncbi:MULTISPECIES: squalene/phytoene synthase family protein [unclassified Kitasatospora]|uniref:phytoene/squalene synthase family protein n=1 Tax=unclassified Kitasatospora TaxID=2633591 RepID=UPI00070BC187|nr:MULTISPECIES: squalene/phytoene synthase family protein [unclassified Kitasatospora]KQV11862.1 phytoene/squalene synthetase [Kitasatospora sp. Root107]KRB68909.1 phytoene/squalene synthetase [Kitasatospora sp. Root187]
MGSWEPALDAAGVHDPGLRAQYGRQRHQVTEYKREMAAAAGLLLPYAMIPHVIAAAAFMHRTDTLQDSGPLADRRTSSARWEREVSKSLATGHSDNPELRPLLNSIVSHPVLRDRVADYLAAAATDLDFTGFDTEDDYQRYVDGYSLPAFMVVAALLGPDGDQSAYRSACRTFIDASQRLDFVNDLAEDLADGRLTIPVRTLEEHGVTRADLEQARPLPGVLTLLTDQLDQVDRTLADAEAVVDLVPAGHQPLLRCIIGIDKLTSTAARSAGTALLHHPAGTPKLPALRLLARQYLRARRHRN